MPPGWHGFTPPMRAAHLFVTAWYTMMPLLRASADDSSTLPVDFLHVPGHNCKSDTPAAGLRGFKGTATECKAKCVGLGPAGCSGFIRVLHEMSGGNSGVCFFREGHLHPPEANEWGDTRDCYIPTWGADGSDGSSEYATGGGALSGKRPISGKRPSWAVLENQNCFGEDLDRSFTGTVESCRDRCAELGPNCTAFVLPKTGDLAGKCFFRSGVIDAETYVGYNAYQTRDCHIPDWGPPPGVGALAPTCLADGGGAPGSIPSAGSGGRGQLQTDGSCWLSSVFGASKPVGYKRLADPAFKIRPEHCAASLALGGNTATADAAARMHRILTDCTPPHPDQNSTQALAGGLKAVVLGASISCGHTIKPASVVRDDITCGRYGIALDCLVHGSRGGGVFISFPRRRGRQLQSKPACTCHSGADEALPPRSVATPT